MLSDPPIHDSAGRQRGFGLLDATVILLVTAVLVALFTRELERSLERAQIDQTRTGVLLLAEALFAYRIQSREWPADVGSLAAYAPAFQSGGRNGVGQPYVLVPPTPLTANESIVIRTDGLTTDHAERVRREFPGTASVSGTVVSIEIPIPGHEPARDSLLALDGSRPMSGDLGLDAHDIADADEVGVRTDVRVGNRVSVTREIDVGSRIIVGGEAVAPGIIRFLNGAGSLGCSGDDRVTISGTTARCAPLPACPVCPVCPPPVLCP